MRTADELWDLYEQARTTPYGAAQIALVEELLKHVDTAGDPSLAFAARLLGTNAYVYGGEPAKAFVTFTWSVSDFDRNPGPHHQRGKHTLLWHFKTMVNSMTKFPEIPLDRTYAVLDDMERRYREDGHSLQAVYKMRYLVTNHVGLPEADEWFERWQAAPRDSLSDCAGCDPSSVAFYLNSRGRYAEAVATAEPVLSGELNCNEQPQGILSNLMTSYLRIGELDKAADAHRRSYRLERGNLADLSDIGDHIRFCARTGNEHRGLEILQRHIDWLEKAPSPSAEMHFAADASMLLRRLTELGHGDTVIRRRDHGEVIAVELATELAGRATALARRFDERNGTTTIGDSIAKDLAAEPYEVVLTLSPAARPVAAGKAPAPSFEPVPMPVPEIPAGATASELLDLALEYYHDDREELIDAVLAEFDVRFSGTSDPLLAGRRAVIAGNRLRRTGHDAVIKHWREAAERFAEAGATGELSTIRARIEMENAYGGGDVDEDLVQADADYQAAHGGALDRANAWGRLSALHAIRGRVADAEQCSDKAVAAAAETGNPRLIAMTAVTHAQVCHAAHKHAEAAASARQAYEFYRAHGPAHRVARAGLVYGHAVEDPAIKVDVFGAVLATGENEAALDAHIARARALVRLGRPVEAVPGLVEAIALCAERGLQEGGAHLRGELADAYRMAGRPVEAAEVAEEALAGFEKLGLEDEANNTRYLLAGQYRQLGDQVGAVTQYRELIERLAGNPAGRGQIGEDLAGLLYDMDRDAEAAAAFEAAAADLRAADDPIGEMRCLRRRIGALNYAGEPDAAVKLIDVVAERFDALPPELAAEPNAMFQRWMTSYEVANVLMSHGRFGEAVPHLRPAPGHLAAVGATDQADRLTGMLGEALLRSGDVTEAERVMRELITRLPADAPSREVAERVWAEVQEAVRGPSTS
nr:tetratricopeptide repeat protein [uncultured Actinoplanes sp.]